VDFVLLTLMANAQRAFVQPDAYEFKYMLTGKVEYTIGDEIIVMEAWDSIFLDATEPHNHRKMGDTAAQLVVLYTLICTNNAAAVLTFTSKGLPALNKYSIW
jgi:glyoxylate utilization-related uncharacterized protein